MITCSRHSDIEKETRKQEKMAPLVISPPLSFHYSGGFRGGARGAQTAPPRPLFLDQTEAQRAEKNFFGAPPPRLSKGLDNPPPYLKVWICHCTITF